METDRCASCVFLFGRRIVGARWRGVILVLAADIVVFIARVCVYVSRSRTRNRVHRVSYLALAVVRFESLKHRATIAQYTSVKEDTLVRLTDDGVFRSRY